MRRHALRAVVLGRFPALVAIALVLFGVLGYLALIPVTVINGQKLAALVPSKALLPHLQPAPAFAGTIPVLPNKLASVTAAANDDPGHTAAYSEQWFGTGSNGGNEQLNLTILPSAAVAKDLFAQEVQQNLTAASITAAKNVLEHRFTVGGLDAEGAQYSIPRSAQSSSGSSVKLRPTTGFTVIARDGRAVVRETAQGATVTRAQSEALAHQVDALLAKRLGSFPSIAATHYPTTASLLYLLVLLALVATALLTPSVARRRAAARRQREAERARYQYRVRGAKNLRRHRTPY